MLMDDDGVDDTGELTDPPMMSVCSSFLFLSDRRTFGVLAVVRSREELIDHKATCDTAAKERHEMTQKKENQSAHPSAFVLYKLYSYIGRLSKLHTSYTSD